MMLSNQQQLMPLFYCLGFGVWVSLLYDLSAVWHAHRSHAPIIRFWQDTLLAALAGIALFLLALATSGGDIRPAMLLAVGGSAYVTHRTIGRGIRTVSNVFLKAMSRCDRFLRQYAARFLVFLQKTSKKAWIFSKKGLQSTFYMLYNKKSP